MYAYAYMMLYHYIISMYRQQGPGSGSAALGASIALLDRCIAGLLVIFVACIIIIIIIIITIIICYLSLHVLVYFAGLLCSMLRVFTDGLFSRVLAAGLLLLLLPCSAAHIHRSFQDPRLGDPIRMSCFIQHA